MRRPPADLRAADRPDPRAAARPPAAARQPAALGGRPRRLVSGEVGPAPRRGPAAHPRRRRRPVRLLRRPPRHALGPAPAFAGANPPLPGAGPRPRAGTAVAARADAGGALLRFALRLPRGHARGGVRLHAADAGLPAPGGRPRGPSGQRRRAAAGRRGSAGRPLPTRGHAGRAVRLRQREVGAPGGPRGLPHRAGAGDAGGVRDLRRGRRLSAARVVERRRLALARGGRSPAPRLLAARARRLAAARLPALGRAGATPAGAARQLVRGRRLLPLGRPPPADRGRVGGGGGARAGG